MLSKTTYHALSDARREAHLVTGLHLIKEVRTSLKETKHRIQETVHTLTSLLGDGKK
jgi:hypothetical protein